MSSFSIYTQAVNFDSFITKGVDPRTGQYTCTIPIYGAPAETRNCPDFDLSVGYNPLNGEDVGFGRGWSLNLSSYQHRRQSRPLVLSTGEQYQVIETTNLVTVKDQKLKSFHFKKSSRGYEVVHKSGQIEILSNTNNTYNTTVPIEIYAANGRSLKLVWIRAGEQPRLSKIQDGLQDLLEIDYAFSSVRIICAPRTTEARTFTLVRNNNQLVEFKLPTGDALAWTFSYQTIGSMNCLISVKSPIGSVEELTYLRNGHRLPNRAPVDTIPYVISHTMRPGSQQPPMITRYSYSALNFLGFNGGRNWDDGEDNLYRVPNDYQYEATVTEQGGATTHYTYNKFHLITRSRRQQNTKRVTRSIAYHASPNTALSDQPAQYQLPKRVETTYQDLVSNSSRTETSEHVFDEWGNPTQDIHVNGIKTDRVYYPATGAENTSTGEVFCPADPHGFVRHLKVETVIPAPSLYPTPSRSQHFRYRELPTAGDAQTDYFITVQQIRSLEDNQDISNTEYTYIDQRTGRDHGRTKQQVTCLSGGKHPITRNWTYQYLDLQNLTETVRATSFDGYTIQDERRYSLFSGRTLNQQDQNGIHTDFQYDRIGRLVTVTVSPNTRYEASRQYDYAIAPGGVGSRVTVTDAKSVQTRYTTDGLERVRRVEKQDDDGQYDDKKNYQGTFRLVSEQSYNALGQSIEMVEIDWLRTNGEPVEQRDSRRIEYDDWGQACRVTHGNGVVVSSIPDPINLTHTQGIEGQGQTKTQLDLRGAPTKRTLLKRDGTLYSEIKYGYDGLGRLVEQTDYFGRTTRHRLDCHDRVIKSIWPDGRITNTRYAEQSAAMLPVSINMKNCTVAEQSFDGLGRVTRRKKAGVRSAGQSFHGNVLEPSQTTMPTGDECHFEYESALDYAITKLTTSGITNDYHRDPQTSAILQSRNNYSTHEFQYSPSGLLVAESIRTKDGVALSTQSTYSMAGKLQRYTDVYGQTHEIQYDTSGRPRHLQQGKLKVSFVYDHASRRSESSVQDGNNQRSLITRFDYDDFSRETGRSVYQGEEMLYRSSQAYGETGLVTTRDLEDGQSQGLRHESFQYDHSNRLIGFQCQGSQSPIDEHNNQLQEQYFYFDDLDNIIQVSATFQDKSQNTASYFYDNEDPTQVTRIVNTHPDYPPQIELGYNDNGCLIRDEQGRTLEYDTMNRLSIVRDAKHEILTQYWYDASGKLVGQRVPGEPDRQFYYREESLIAVTIGDRHVSYVSDGEKYWGQNLYQKGSCQTQLWASDSHQSVIAWLDAQQPNTIHHQRYTPYGSSAGGCSIGFNGQWRDPVTGWYHLGNGYRVYNPVLMRFHTPDRWSPFTSGEINAYAYCAGDPINHVDPSGHSSGSRLRRWLIRAVFIGATILAGVLTGGASIAIKIGVGIAVGVASHVLTGAAYDLATGSTPTLASVATDAKNGALAGATKGKSKVAKTLKRLFKKQENVTSNVPAENPSSPDQANDGATSTGADDNSGQSASESSLTSDNQVGQFNSQAGESGLPGSSSSLAAKRITIGFELEAGERANPAMASSSPWDPTFTLYSDYDATSGNARAVAELLNREHRCYFGSLSPLKGIRAAVVDDAFDKSGTFRAPFRSARNIVRRPNIMEVTTIPEGIS